MRWFCLLAKAGTILEFVLMRIPDSEPLWRTAKSLSVLLLSLLFPVVGSGADRQDSTNPGNSRSPHVLFIIVDDLRPELGCYGEKAVLTPNLDALAEQSLVFDHAYCQQAVCMSSRNSMLSGLRPDERKIWTNRDVRKDLLDLDFFPGHFRSLGYHSVGIGKIAHNSWEDPRCWSDKHLKPENIAYEYRTRAGRELVEQMQKEAEKAGLPDPFRDVEEKIRRGMAWESPDVDDSDLGDGQIADLALKTLARAGGRKEGPLFLGVGFLRPHLPFVAPKKYWDLYEADGHPVDTEMAPYPEGAPDVANNRSRELLMQYRGLPKKLPLEAQTKTKLIQGYRASVSYVDAQIGRVLAGLRESGLEKDSIVVVTSDHGFQLGEQEMWGKATNFELSTRVPLLIKTPGMSTAGQRCSSFVELVDLYPTLCDLAGLPKPDHLQGNSFAELLSDPERVHREVAISQYHRGGEMGHSARSGDFRYTEWRELKSGKLLYRELYDLRESDIERTNVVDEKKLSEVVAELAAAIDRERSDQLFP